jgi:DNA-binding NarL/FixJ family response regulator
VEASRHRIILVARQIDRIRLRNIIERSARYDIVAETADARAALRLASEAAPQIAVIDEAVPDTSGLGLAHLLSHYHPRVQLLLHTGALSEADILEALREGVRGFVLRAGAETHLLPALDALSDQRPYWEGAVADEVFQRLVGGPPFTGEGLTAQERLLVQLVAEGHSTRSMAEIMDLPIKTAESMRIALRRKLRVRTTADLVRYAIDHGIIKP